MWRNHDGAAWQQVRLQALTPQEAVSTLARRPYEVRHACVSTRPAAGVPSTQAAGWAGHPVTVLHESDAKVLTGLERNDRRRIRTVLEEDPE